MAGLPGHQGLNYCSTHVSVAYYRGLNEGPLQLIQEGNKIEGEDFPPKATFIVRVKRSF